MSVFVNMCPFFIRRALLITKEIPKNKSILLFIKPLPKCVLPYCDLANQDFLSMKVISKYLLFVIGYFLEIKVTFLEIKVTDFKAEKSKCIHKRPTLQNETDAYPLLFKTQ